jgi:hypothetical protein
MSFNRGEYHKSSSINHKSTFDRLRKKMGSWKRARGGNGVDDVERLQRENRSLMEKIRLERSVGQRMLQTIEKLKREQGLSSSSSSSSYRAEAERLRRELQSCRENADTRVRQLIEENRILLENLDEVMSARPSTSNKRRIAELESQVEAMMIAQRKTVSMYNEEIESLKQERTELRKHIDSMKTRITIMDAEHEVQRDDEELLKKLSSLKSQLTIMEADHEVDRKEWEMERQSLIQDLKYFARREKKSQHHQSSSSSSSLSTIDRQLASHHIGEMQIMMRNVEGVLRREVETKRDFKTQVRAQVSEMERAMRRVRDALEKAQSRESFIQYMKKESSNQCNRFVSILTPVMKTIQREISFKKSFKNTVKCSR